MVRPKNRNNQKKRKSRPRRRRFAQSTAATGGRGLIAYGIRTLMSVIPGGKLISDVADFAFKSLGYTKRVTVSNTGSFEADMQVTGLTSLFHIALKDILLESHTHGVRLSPAEWASNYQAGRLKSITIKCIPQSPMGERCGQIAMAFIPFRSAEDNKYYDQQTSGLLYSQVKVLPGAKSSSSNQTISITFIPKVRDGRLVSSLALDEEIGAITVAFDQTSRANYGMFAAEDFSCTILVSGIIQLVRPQEYPTQNVYGRRIDDRLRNRVAFMSTSDKKMHYSVSGEIKDFGSHLKILGVLDEETLSRHNAYILGDNLMQ